MLQGNGFYGEASVFVDDGGACGVYGVEDDLEFEAVAKQFYLRMKHCFEFFRGVDMEGGSASEQAEGTDETNKTEAMVAMEMGDEDGTELGETCFRAAKLNLRTLAAVYHEELFA